MEYMLGIGVDWVALSFVQRPSDIEEIIQLIDEKLPPGQFKPCIMAKVEKPSCFDGDNLERIVELCNGIMVARGDLGVEWYVLIILFPSLSRALSRIMYVYSVLTELLIRILHRKNKYTNNIALRKTFHCYKSKSLTNVADKERLWWWPHKCSNR